MKSAGDEEEYKKDFEEEKFTLSNTLNLGLVQNNARVLVVNQGASTAVVKILLETELKEAGDVKATKKEKENAIITAKYS